MNTFDHLFPDVQTIKRMASSFTEKRILSTRRRVRNIHRVCENQFFVGEFYYHHRRLRCFRSAWVGTYNRTWYEVDSLSPIVFEEERNRES